MHSGRVECIKYKIVVPSERMRIHFIKKFKMMSYRFVVIVQTYTQELAKIKKVHCLW